MHAHACMQRDYPGEHGTCTVHRPSTGKEGRVHVDISKEVHRLGAGEDVLQLLCRDRQRSEGSDWVEQVHAEVDKLQTLWICSGMSTDIESRSGCFAVLM